MNMRPNKLEELERMTGCEVARKVKYLGIVLTTKNLDLFKNNYEKVWDEIQKDLNKWDSLRLSLLGRIASIKMNVLPRFMFSFQAIPIIRKDKILDALQRKINKFIWSGKRPRIKLKCLCDRKERGGLQLPNI